MPTFGYDQPPYYSPAQEAAIASKDWNPEDETWDDFIDDPDMGESDFQ